jgi:hypothetical protein
MAMSASGGWKSILARSEKPKVTVTVGKSAQDLTHTQARRFNELTRGAVVAAPAANDNPLEQSRYSLEDAAFRRMTSADDILKRAASGAINLYVSAKGLRGCWRRLAANGDRIESSVRKLRSGHLRLAKHLCKELALTGVTSARVLEYPDDADLYFLDFDIEMLEELSAWGHEKKIFCMSEPRGIVRGEVILLGAEHQPKK